MTNTSNFDYELPAGLIAAYPTERRDESRLLIAPIDGHEPEHRHFRNLPEYLRPGDLLVVNDSRVLPARLLGSRLPGGGACELLLLEPAAGAGDAAVWNAMVKPGRKLRPGTQISLPGKCIAEIDSVFDDGTRRVRFDMGAEEFPAYLEKHGAMPLPPYILAKRSSHAAEDSDRERYQTVYARDAGSVAAPTAGLHFTPELLAAIEQMGVRIARVTLHVGAGTFAPIETDHVEDHPMHSEWYTVPAETADAIAAAKAEGRHVIAVGTTSVRTLESATDPDGNVRAGSGDTKLMIRPGYDFRVIDGLITNFHLPKSTLLCLVAAMLGHDPLMRLYKLAVAERYRFYSYGDAMFIPPKGRP